MNSTRFEQFVGKIVTLNIGINTTQKVEGKLLEANLYGALVETQTTGAMFYPWHAIYSIDVSQAYGSLKVA